MPEPQEIVEQAITEAREGELCTLLKEQNLYLKKLISVNRSFTSLLYQGIVRGLGIALGATLIFSLIITLLRPLAKIDFIQPIADEIINRLDSKPAPYP